MASESGDSAHGRHLGTMSTSVRGTSGIHFVESAEPLPTGTLVIGTLGEYFKTSDLLESGDSHRRLAVRAFLTFAPIDPIDLSLSWASTSNWHSAPFTEPAQTNGDPVFSLKAGRKFTDEFGVGTVIDMSIPTSANGTVLEMKATSLTTRLLASYQLSPLVFALNVGYRFDNGEKIFSPTSAPFIDAVKRFDMGIARTDSVVASLGAEGNFDIDVASIVPFLEFQSAFGTDAESSQNPIVVGGGVKSYMLEDNLLKVAVGGNYRISGAPAVDGNFPGVPPWEVFLHMALNIGLAAAEKAPPDGNCGSASCSASNRCPDELTCLDGRCVVLREREIIKEVVTELVQEAPTFLVSGVVTHAVTKRPLRDATVTVSGFEKTVLVTSSEGSFQSWPLVVGSGNLQISIQAEGFQPSTQTINKGPAGSVTPLAIALTPITGKMPPGILRGQMTDAQSGKPIKGMVVIPSSRKRIAASVEGTFEVTLNSGEFGVIISCSGYVTQKMQIKLRSGEVVILNVDMTPQR